MTLLIHRNLRLFQEVVGNNNPLMELINPREALRSLALFPSDVQAHVNLLTQLLNSIRDKFQEIFSDSGRHYRSLIGGLETILKTITGNLCAADGEFFTNRIKRLKQIQL